MAIRQTRQRRDPGHQGQVLPAAGVSLSAGSDRLCRKQSYNWRRPTRSSPGKRYDVVFVDPPHDPRCALFRAERGLEHT